MPLPLRLLAGAGALAFILIGANMILLGMQSLLDPPRPQPAPGPPAAPRLPSA